MLSTLERHGYLRRFQSNDDQRVVYIALTDSGRALQEDFEAISGSLLDRVYGRMAQDDRQRLVRLLAALERNLTEDVETV
jgi:DNA-binding MarR family transcriptional regulator